jgi:hypothetical protein
LPEQSKPFFCSELSRRSAEKTFGTASVGAVWLLLEYPHGWGRKAFEESALSDAVKNHLKDTLARVKFSRLLFVKTDRARRDERMNLFVVRCREREPFVARLRVKDYEDVRSLDLAAVASGRDLQGGELTDGPLYLVCTHGRRDKCCAKFGIPVFNTLRDCLGESDCAGESVWQSSHVGGDRFAANLVCFPHGLFYAHTTEESAKQIVSEYRAGRVVLDKFRGRACYLGFTQAAEFFARNETGLTEIGALRFRSSAPEGPSAWRVRFVEESARRTHELLVASRASDFRNFVTCHSEDERPVPQFALEDYKLIPT